LRATEGYQPKNTDLQEAERRKTAAAPVAVPVKEAPAPRTARKAKATEPAQRSQEKAVWNAVETNGKLAREQDSVKPAEKPVETSPAAAVAA
jgi:hypothetical protein